MGWGYMAKTSGLLRKLGLLSDTDTASTRDQASSVCMRGCVCVIGTGSLVDLIGDVTCEQLIPKNSLE